MKLWALVADAITVAGWYVAAVLLRVGGRLEYAELDFAAEIAAMAALLQVSGNLAVGAYRPGWPRRTSDLTALAVPAIGVGLIAALFNVVNETHPIPYAAIPPAIAVTIATEAAIHLRPRWSMIAAAIAGRRSPQGELPMLLPEPQLEQLFLAPDTSVRAAVGVIDGDVSRIALVVDQDRRLLGVVTDGDVRRALLAGVDLTAAVTAAMTTTPVVAPVGTPDDEVVDLMQLRAVRQIPLVDPDGRVVEIKLFGLLRARTDPLCPVVIMAGGLGTRLGDKTRRVPKPLVRIAGRPILELLIRDLALQGFRRIVLAVNHRADLIEDYFGDGSKLGVQIDYVRETTPLGTAGPIRLVRSFVENEFIVTNADLLTRVNFRELLSFHRRQGHELTVAVTESTLQLRYGLIETEGSRVIGIREKPAIKHFVNAGIYVLRKSVIDSIPSVGPFDMDRLIASALERNSFVGCFPIHEYWVDIGEPDDLARASEELASQPRRAAH